MVTKKRVFVMVLIFLMVAGMVSAGAVGRGGFGAGQVLAASSTDDATVRPFQRFQSLDADDIAACPCIGEDGEFDQEAFDARQAERAAWRTGVQSQAMMGRQGRQVAPAASYGPRGASMQNRNFTPAASYGPNRAPMQGRTPNARPGMMGAQPASGASYGPVWAR